ANELIEMGVGAVGPIGGGRQPQAEWSDGAGRGQTISGTGQMMALIEDDQSEAASETVHIQVGRVVSGYRQRLDVVVSAAEQTDLDAKAECELVIPLVHEVDGRRDDQRRPAGLLDGHAGKVRLPGPSGEDDDAPAPGLPPGRQTLSLV